MRYSLEHKQQTRQRIVAAAARRFRRRGGEGAGIGDLMHDLHLTHGGFYRHFGSKEELFAEAFERSLAQIRQRIAASVSQTAGRSKREALKAIIDTYLDAEHCRDAANGCPLAALAPEVARRPKTERAPFVRALHEHVRLLSAYFPGDDDRERTRNAAVLFSGMAGTLALARTAIDDRERDAILAAGRRFYLSALS